MMPRFLKISWWPVVIGEFFAAWAHLSGYMMDLHNRRALWVASGICLVVALLWAVAAIVWRTSNQGRTLSRTERMMCDLVVYPFLVLLILLVVIDNGVSLLF